MGCQKRQILISRFHRGELSDSEAESLRGHIEKCADCQAMDAEYRSVERFLAASGDPIVPPFLDGRIIARVAGQMKKDRNAGPLGRFFAPLRVLKPMHVAAVIILALFAGVLTGSNFLPISDGVTRKAQNDLVSMAFGTDSPNSSTFDLVCSDDQGDR
jgi:anti-sigma factor RsiW